MPDDKAFHILVALARQPLHGYAIRQEVETRTEGQVRLWPATLYGLLADLTQRRLIEETDGSGPTTTAPRYYAPREGRRFSRRSGTWRACQAGRNHLGLGKARA
jgi:DNA-binding PadR family transcriptional regulator